MNRKSRRSAFTLLELLAVVVILAILAAAIIPRVVVSSNDARNSVHQHNLSAINTAVERYYIDNGAFPADITDLTPDYLPDGAPAVPTDATQEYTLDGNNRATTQAIP